MMKFFFWLFLLGNGALFAYHQGHLADFFPKQHDPERMKQQLNADKIQLIGSEAALEKDAASSSASSPATSPASPPVLAGALPPVSTPVPAPQAAPQATPTPAPTPAPQAVAGTNPAAGQIACVEIGDFTVADAKGFETELVPLALGARQSRRNVPQVSAYVVQMPPQGSKEAADKKAGELRNLKVTDFYVINDENSPVRWSISLGVYKTKVAAQKQLDILNRQGVQTAVISPRTGNTNKLAYQWRNLSPDLVAKISAISAKYPGQERKTCKS